MQKRQLETLLYSTGGIIALVAILVAGNFLLGFLNLRADLTEGNVYTLSPGTRAVLAKLEAPVKLRLYYTQSGEAVPEGAISLGLPRIAQGLSREISGQPIDLGARGHSGNHLGHDILPGEPDELMPGVLVEEAAETPPPAAVTPR